MATAYADCGHIKRTEASQLETDAVRKAIGDEFRVLPLYEKGTYDYNHRKHYSMITNEFLKCRWKEFKSRCATRHKTSVQFVDMRDLHFYNASIRLRPQQSVHDRTGNRMKMTTGPGVDNRGFLPIAQELLIKRTIGPKKEPKKYLKGSLVLNTSNEKTKKFTKEES